MDHLPPDATGDRNVVIRHPTKQGSKILKYALRYFVAVMYGNDREIRRAIRLSTVVNFTYVYCAAQMVNMIREGIRPSAF